MTTPFLTPAHLETLPSAIRIPDYDRSAVSAGIVHIGVGGFHRAHQAVLIDDVLASDPSWGIVGASLRHPAMRDALAPQGFLYTVVTRGESGDRYRVIGSLLDILVALDDVNGIVARLADPSIRIVTLTVTEKGYCVDPASGRLDVTHPEIVADCRDRERPCTAPGLIVAGLRRRYATGIEPFTVLTCDNLSKNGNIVRASVIDFARLSDPDIVPWLEDHLACPSTMVDRIVPKTTEQDIEATRQTCGYADAWPVVAEPFCQWVIEDNFPLGRPSFESSEVVFVSNVHSHEEMKLRLLNGSHSALAYIGLLAGYATVAETMRDTAIRRYLERLALADLAPTLDGPKGVDLAAYIRSLHLRFANTGIRHELVQIASDGSQKIPQRLLPAMRQRVRGNANATFIATAIAAWIHCWQRSARGSLPSFSDPMAVEFARAVGQRDDPARVVEAAFALPGVFDSDDLARFGADVNERLQVIVQSGLFSALLDESS